MATTNEFDNLIDSPSKVTPGIPQPKPQPSPISNQTNHDKIDAETYSDAELSNVNAININVTDTATPVVVFFGPSSSGKTMALLRMIRYFQHQMGFTVQAERTFRPSHDRHYQRMCDGLGTMVNDEYAPKNTDIISFMLVKVFDQAGRAIVQILEAPGEHYFDEKAPTAQFPRYILNILNLPNKKIWVYFAEQDWKDQTDRNNYATKIREMQVKTPRDKVVFLFNKCDKQLHQYGRDGRPRTELYLRAVEQQYPGIFTAYSNSGIAKVLFGPYKFHPICFSSGDFASTQNGRQAWVVGQNFYCDNLWKALRNS